MKFSCIKATMRKLSSHWLRCTGWSTKPGVRIVIFGFLGLLLPAICCGQAQTSAVLERLRQEACGPYQSDFDRIMAGAPGHPSLQRLQATLNIIDKVTASIITDMEAHRAAFSMEKLAKIEGENQRTRQKPVGAAAIFANYLPSFHEDPIPVDFESKDQAALRSYYVAFISARTQFVDLYGQTVAAVYHGSTREVLELCLVLRLLTTADSSWSAMDGEKLPVWMKPPQNLAALELFTLRVKRLQTAYQFHKEGELASKSKALDKYPTYLSTAADQLMQINDFDAAVFCLQSAVRVAQADGATTSTVASLEFRIADVLSSTRRFKEAADEIQTLVALPIGEHEYARARLLRLKYLFGAGQNAQVLSEAADDRRDPRCVAYAPQILYISWIAARQDANTTSQADESRKEFLAQFPNHPLAADIYFASAMEALSSGDYKIATQTFQLIVQKFPDSPVATKANDLEKRLENASPVSGKSSGT